MSSSWNGPDGLPARMLVVDDDADILNFIRGVLEDEGLGVVAVPDGGQAIALAAEFEPDMPIVDVTLPVLSGHRVTRANSAHTRT